MHESAKISEEIPGDAKIVILAGRGQYPVICAKNIKRYGFDFTVIAVDDTCFCFFADMFHILSASFCKENDNI